MPFGQVYSSGVKYIKINRFDSDGSDRSGYLEQLQTLRIVYDDLGIINYNIITTQEHDNYYIYSIEPQVQPSSSIDYNILDYSLETNKSTPVITPVGFQKDFTDYDSTPNNPLGYFNSLAGTYRFSSTPNIPITASFTASARLVNPGILSDKSNIRLIISGPNYFSFDVLSDLTDFTSTAYTTITGSTILYPRPTSSQLIEDSIVFLRANNASDSTSTFIVKDVTLTFSPWYAPTSSTSLIVFQPDFVDFFYNDYNPIFGNAEIAQYSSKYMDIDYTSNYTKPINFSLIISGTADKAQVQDSNYESSAWSNIRYNGSRYSSYNFNKPFPSPPQFGGIFNNVVLPALPTEYYTGDPTYNTGYTSGVPNVEQNKTYFAYFDGVGGTGPEIIGKTAYFIKWLIDENGEVSDPQPGNIALLDLLNSFESGKNAKIRLISGDPLETSNPNDDSLIGTYGISHVGRIATMLVTQTGSSKQDYLSAISFNYLDGNSITQATDNIEASWKYGGNYITANSADWTYFDFNAVVEPGIGAWGHPTNNDYELVYAGGTLAANTRIKIALTFYLRKASSDAQNNTFLPRLLKNDDPSTPIPLNPLFTNAVGNNTNYASVQTDSGYYYTWETDWFDTNENDTFQIQYQVGTGGDGFAIEIVGTNGGANGTLIKFRQENPIATGLPPVPSPYWGVGNYPTGNSVSVLTASQALYNIYNTYTSIQSSPPQSLAFGFSPCSLAFDPRPGDYIRFEYNENRLHMITKVSTVSPTLVVTQTGSLFLTVVPPIATSSLLDNFVLYRIINDGTYIVLDVPKNTPGSSFTGIIQPQYVSQNVTNNFDSIIQNLTQRNLIS